jgi:diguanylate cyclase (GGDEF)-like protein
MDLNLAKVFGEYPNPFFIIRPIINDGRSENFEYVYANEAFCIFLGRSSEELIGHSYLENFEEKGERDWLNVFMNTVRGKKHTYINNISTVAEKKLFVEAFYVVPDLCCCIIHDFQSIPSYMTSNNVREIRHRANYDFFTGFYNRYYFREVASTLSGSENMGVLYLDINNLKGINEEKGRAAGDALIKDTADMIRIHFIDCMIFRLLGDDFLIISTGLERGDFLGLANDCRQYFDRDGTSAVGYKFYDETGGLEQCVEECRALMKKHKKKMKESQVNV